MRIWQRPGEAKRGALGMMLASVGDAGSFQGSNGSLVTTALV